MPVRRIKRRTNIRSRFIFLCWRRIYFLCWRKMYFCDRGKYRRVKVEFNLFYCWVHLFDLWCGKVQDFKLQHLGRFRHAMPISALRDSRKVGGESSSDCGRWRLSGLSLQKSRPTHPRLASFGTPDLSFLGPIQACFSNRANLQLKVLTVLFLKINKLFLIWH